MEADARTRFISRMSQRGVSLKSFDGRTLTVHYDAEADTELLKDRVVNVETLSLYVKDALEALPGAAAMFPGLDDIVVEFPATD
jgi:hypothetical protein